MIKTLFLLLIGSVFLYATTITEQKVYAKEDRVDLMLTFDTPYEGKISKTTKEGDTILLLDKLDAKEKFSKTLTSPIIDQITVASGEGKVLIKLQSSHPIQVEASKTIDKRGMRIRIKSDFLAQHDTTLKPIPAPIETPATDYNFSFAFMKVMFVLGGLILLLWFLKKWLEKRNNQNWLFGKDGTQEDIKVLQQKPIDMKNRVVLLGYEEKKYLLLLGENNLLLDKFEDEEAAFEKLLQKNGKKLKDYLEA